MSLLRHNEQKSTAGTNITSIFQLPRATRPMTTGMPYGHCQSGRLEQEGRSPMAKTSPHGNLLLHLCLL
jgi:hypothetical protein